MSESDTQKSEHRVAQEKGLTPGANEVALKLDKEIAAAYHDHLNSGTPLADEHAAHVAMALEEALDTESHEEREALAAHHEDEVVTLVTVNGARLAQTALKGEGEIDHAAKVDLARRIQTAVHA